MITSIKDLINKTTELEQRLNKFEKSTAYVNEENLFSSYVNNNLFTNVTTRKTINLIEINNSKKQIYFQLQVNFNLSTNQDVEFSLLVNNIKIATLTQNFDIGNNNTIISGIHQDTINDKLNIKISVNPKNDNLTIINTVNLLTWGNKTEQTLNEYECVETSDSFILSYLSNNRVYLKTLLKNSLEYQDEIDLKYIVNAKSHSITFDHDNNNLYLFRVDLNKNLFYSKLDTLNEIFISNNVENVSCCYGNNKLLFSFISNNDCYFGEIINNSIFINQIKVLKGNFINSYLYFKDKCYLIITKSNHSNYLLEESNLSFDYKNQINAEIILTITTYEAI